MFKDKYFVRKVFAIGIGLVLIISIIWYLFIANTFIRVSVAPGTTHYTLSSTVSGKVVATGTTNGIKHIPRGSYFLRGYGQSSVATITIKKTPLLPFASVMNKQAVPTENYSIPVVGDFADYTTPLTDGSYVYLNNQTKAVEIASKNGITDVSSQFNLAIGKLSTYNRVVNILSTRGGSAVVVTTKEVYLLTSAGSIQVLKSYVPKFSPNYYAAAYDSNTDSILLLNAYDKAVYMYDLSQPFQGISTLFTASQQIQAITAGNGTAILYGNDFPATSAAILEQYALRTIVTPIQISIASKKQISTLSYVKNAVAIQPSPTNSYIAVKQKYSTVLVIYDTKTNQKVIELPAYDISGMTWIGNTLYVGRDNAIWSYTVGSNDPNLHKTAEVGSGIIRLIAYSNTLTISTVAQNAQTVTIGSTNPTDMSAVKKLTLNAKGYSIVYSNIANNLYIDSESSSQIDNPLNMINPITSILRRGFSSSTVTQTSGRNQYNGIYQYATVNLTLQ